jgi:hypothetical protein
MTGDTFIMGNPPFNGPSYFSDEQRADTDRVWSGTPRLGVLDYVTNWFLIASQWASSNDVKCGFVSTNSITQGQQPSVLWGRLLALGVGIDFAYRTFAWDNGAAVHVVIIGFSTALKPAKRPLFSFNNIKGEPQKNLVPTINAYLLDAPDILISSRTMPLQPETPLMNKGSQPTDNGQLSSISRDEAEQIRLSDPVAAKYLRRLIGGQEFIQGKERYCLWLLNAEPGDLRSSATLKSRIQGVREFRLASPKKATQKDASRPHEFQEKRQPSTEFIAIPEVSSENRDYVPIGFFEPTFVPTNKIQVIEGGGLRVFGILVSRVFSVWVESISGRLKSDFSISSEITYNNFPFPELSVENTELIEKAASAVLDSRKLYPNSSLADLYDTLSMPSDLRKCHEQLDRAVVAAYGLKPSSSDEQILSELFRRYDELTRGLLEATPMPKPRRSRS